MAQEEPRDGQTAARAGRDERGPPTSVSRYLMRGDSRETRVPTPPGPAQSTLRQTNHDTAIAGRLLLVGESVVRIEEAY